MGVQIFVLNNLFVLAHLKSVLFSMKLALSWYVKLIFKIL